ncbi:Cyclic di-GMP phosphodiesterase Gmr [Legionella massiliensis]|uniref:Cyclic di-GMP phosphodiesterase Gmr n=1 Tax=Legionella massiliensis TaxID=1034943 RepID=A0A078KVL6_9GAMM|nr:PAS domain S-box protein [Legionella massiliensis]CDZ78455.1 Cyclic di-GMP phosphodiesterase Gmr [Legionella massiliensis]CEE14193.1 Cyclic di-GMP phosphodiesterase Gmr [Legionella massiliensis]
MDEYQLIYISSLDPGSNSREFNEIFEQLSAYSLEHNLSGFLLYSEHSFLQILEGERKDIHIVFNSISNYLRKSEHLILSEKPIKRRNFQNSFIRFKQIEQSVFNDLYRLSLLGIESFIKRLVTLAEESTAKKPAQSSKFESNIPINNKFFHYSTEVSSDEVFLMNDESQIVYANNAACESLGYTNDELVGMFVWQWDPFFPQEVWPAFWHEFIDKKQLHFETQHRKKTGEVFPVEIRAHLFVKDNENYILAFVNDITHRKKTESELLAHKVHLERIIESKNEELKKSIELLKLHKELVDIHSSLCITDASGKITYVNNLYCQLSGYTRDELLGQNHRILKSGLHDKAFYQNLYQTIEAGHVWRRELCNKRKDGKLYWVDATIVPRVDANGNPIEYYSIKTDITSRKYTEIALIEKAEQIRTILELAGDGIHILDEDGNVVECSQSFAESLGYTKAEALKLNVRDWDACIPGDEMAAILEKLLASPATFETKHRRKDNSIFDVEINAKGISLKEKNYIYASSRDISDRLEEQRKIKRMASTDQLTGLANRYKFVEHFEHNLNLAQREKEKLVLILADLNKFKGINDQYGHMTGDEVLKQVADLLTENCRQYDLAARIGGDEFAILLIHTDAASAIRYIEKILLSLQKPLKINEDEIFVGLSFGIALYPKQAQTIVDLFKKADLALYNAKNKGKSGYFY